MHKPFAVACILAYNEEKTIAGLVLQAQRYVNREVYAGKVAQMLGIPRAAFYQLLAEKRVPLPEKLNRSVLKELVCLERKFMSVEC